MKKSIFLTLLLSSVTHAEPLAPGRYTVIPPTVEITPKDETPSIATSAEWSIVVSLDKLTQMRTIKVVRRAVLDSGVDSSLFLAVVGTDEFTRVCVHGHMDTTETAFLRIDKAKARELDVFGCTGFTPQLESELRLGKHAYVEGRMSPDFLPEKATVDLSGYTATMDHAIGGL